LLHVISEPDEDYFGKAEEKKKWLDQYRRRVETFLEQYRRELIAAGFPAEAVKTSSPLRYCPSIASASCRNSTTLNTDPRARAAGVVAQRGVPVR